MSENQPKDANVDVDVVMDIGAECSICQRAKTDPVSAHCGHSFCWVCINEYLLATRCKARRRCPVCGIDMEAHVPGYGKQPKIDQNLNKEMVTKHCTQFFRF